MLIFSSHCLDRAAFTVYSLLSFDSADEAWLEYERVEEEADHIISGEVEAKSYISFADLVADIGLDAE